jgi:hypothetical protein
MGSSGGPVIDIESGAVVGLIRGSRLDNRIAGLRGWATTSESIFEVRETTFLRVMPNVAHLFPVPL